MESDGYSPPTGVACRIACGPVKIGAEVQLVCERREFPIVPVGVGTPAVAEGRDERPPRRCVEVSGFADVAPHDVVESVGIASRCKHVHADMKREAHGGRVGEQGVERVDHEWLRRCADVQRKTSDAGSSVFGGVRIREQACDGGRAYMASSMSCLAWSLFTVPT